MSAYHQISRFSVASLSINSYLQNCFVGKCCIKYGKQLVRNIILVSSGVNPKTLHSAAKEKNTSSYLLRSTQTIMIAYWIPNIFTQSALSYVSFQHYKVYYKAIVRTAKNSFLMYGLYSFKCLQEKEFF